MLRSPYTGSLLDLTNFIRLAMKPECLMYGNQTETCCVTLKFESSVGSLSQMVLVVQTNNALYTNHLLEQFYYWCCNTGEAYL